MCDYSLHAQPNRLACEGDELVLARFPGGSRGFAPQKEYEEFVQRQVRRVRPSATWKFKRILSCFKSTATIERPKPLCAVCVPPGAKLQLYDIPASLQEDLRVGSNEEVTFTQLSCEAYTYRDAVRFANGKEVLLQQLHEKQRAVVLSLGDHPERLPLLEGVEDYALLR